jgi:hypothetical protein
MEHIRAGTKRGVFDVIRDPWPWVGAIDFTFVAILNEPVADFSCAPFDTIVTVNDSGGDPFRFVNAGTGVEVVDPPLGAVP